jgi:FkbM family methyltransferase
MKNLVQSLFGKLGYRITKLNSVWTPDFGLESFFPLLKSFGFAPRHILDVGANHGHWTRTAIRFFPEAQYTLVEPQDHLKMHIQDLLAAGRKIQWINAGAGDTSGTLPFALAPRDDSSTFVFDADRARAAGVRQIMLPVRTLNEIVASTGAPPPEMVKIDAEGFDLKVLAGASDLLGVTDVFLVEACICSHDGDNTALAIINFMAQAGYRLIDITDLNRSPTHQVLWLAEFAFLRTSSPLLSRVSSYE